MTFSLIQMFRKWLYNTKLKQKIMYTYLLLIIFPLGVYQFIASDKMSQTIINHVTYSAEQGFDQTYSFLNYRVQRIAETTNVLVSNPLITEILMDQSLLQDINRQLKDYNELKQLLRSMQDSLDISRVLLYVPKSYIFSNETENFLPLSSTSGSPCFTRLQTQNSKYIWCSPMELTDSNHASDSLYVVRSILDPNDYRVTIGQLRMDVQADALRTMLKKANVVKNSTTYLVGSNQQMILSSDSTDFPSIKLPSGDLNQETKSIEKNNNYYLYRPIPSSQWSMVTVIPLDEVTKQSRELRNDLLVLLIAVAVIAYGVAYILAISVTRRTSYLTSRLRDVQNGNLIALAQSQGKDEIGELIRTYNYMIEKISSMNMEQYKLGQEVKSAELKALQSQINPHFLYNTLDLINWMADSGMNNEIKNVVKALSRFYKLSLSNGKDIITLRDELKHVSFYVQIQNIRYENKIVFEMNVDEEIMDCAIPKITLQPIVENAIHHGILGRESRQGIITITGTRVDNDIRISIQDNGIGMNPDLLERLTFGETTPRLTGSGYGTKNVVKRIQHYFGESYGLSYKSVWGEGTVVDIHIPVTYEVD